MKKYNSIPLMFFFIAALLGLLIRWHFIYPFEHFRYPFFLHAHSHIMFLGWIFNSFYLFFVESHDKEGWEKKYKTLFVVLQVLVVAMLISFPLQGYGAFSIVFSTLHTVLTVVFIVKFWTRLSMKPASVSSWHLKASFVFLLLSSAGPFALGLIVANGLANSNWYRFAVYYYLHFQYNGFFIMGVLTLFFKLLEEKGIVYDTIQAKRIGMLLAIACIPTYFLSILWAEPGILYNVIGSIGSILQFGALFVLFLMIKKIRKDLQRTFKPISYFMLTLVFFCFTVKLILQFISSYPLVASLAYNVRPFVIAYLHLVLVGIISLFLLVWYIEKSFLPVAGIKIPLIFFVIGFFGTELCMILSPMSGSFSWVSHCLMLFSVVLVSGVGIMAFMSLHTISKKKVIN